MFILGKRYNSVKNDSLQYKLKLFSKTAVAINLGFSIIRINYWNGPIIENPALHLIVLTKK